MLIRITSTTMDNNNTPSDTKQALYHIDNGLDAHDYTLDEVIKAAYDNKYDNQDWPASLEDTDTQASYYNHRRTARHILRGLGLGEAEWDIVASVEATEPSDREEDDIPW